jgi:hypothetical protein
MKLLKDVEVVIRITLNDMDQRRLLEFNNSTDKHDYEATLRMLLRADLDAMDPDANPVDGR